LKWRQERDARMGSVESRVNNIKELISSLSEERLEIQRKIQELKGSDLPKGDKTVALSQMMDEASKLDDGVSKWNKTLENLDKKNKVSLSLYIHVMERVMKAIEKKHPNIFSQLIDFQEEHLTEIAEQLS